MGSDNAQRPPTSIGLGLEFAHDFAQIPTAERVPLVCTLPESAGGGQATRPGLPGSSAHGPPTYDGIAAQQQHSQIDHNVLAIYPPGGHCAEPDARILVPPPNLHISGDPAFGLGILHHAVRPDSRAKQHFAAQYTAAQQHMFAYHDYLNLLPPAQDLSPPASTSNMA
ncbi:hypothetical protein FH972_026249 [Carpinus fangiana]|uniref:Uncharacterized protein n=1 Tax=Carpinus fangiana TaxID=176857 RepID=A0A5N6L611_9ROSI|nr:hypothetical protein FH972_026249 [Carpinus fangiana]